MFGYENTFLKHLILLKKGWGKFKQNKMQKKKKRKGKEHYRDA